MELTYIEKKIVVSSVKRHKSFFYKWGHLLGWLTIPLVLLRFVPAFRNSTWIKWTNILIIPLCIEWYHVTVTRLIGKLCDNLKNEDKI